LVAFIEFDLCSVAVLGNVGCVLIDVAQTWGNAPQPAGVLLITNIHMSLPVFWLCVLLVLVVCWAMLVVCPSMLPVH